MMFMIMSTQNKTKIFHQSDLKENVELLSAKIIVCFNNVFNVVQYDLILD